MIHLPTKSSFFFLWTLDWVFFHQLQSVQALEASLLYKVQKETIEQLFFNCIYTRHILVSISESFKHALWRRKNSPILRIEHEMTVGNHNILEIIQSFTKEDPANGATLDLRAMR